MRKIIDLNFNWLFNPTYDDEHIKEYLKIDNFKSVNIPHNAVDIPYNNFDVSMIQGNFTYKKSVYIEESYKEKDLILVFDGVANIADVFINDDYIMTNRGGYTPFSVDITEYVRYGEDNMITVIVDSHENVFIPPYGASVDYLGYSGIYREVRLEVLNKERILDYFVKTPNPTNSNFISLDLNLSTVRGILEINVSSHKTILISTKIRVQANNMSVNIDIGEKNLWDIDDPFLYDIEIRLIQNEVLVDSIKSRFAFRDIDFRSDGFYLNGKKIKLVGLNRHQSFPYVGNAMPKSMQVLDADIIKYDLNCNIVRSSHYPASPHFLDRCDEIGLLVMEELPGWQHIGNEEWQQTALKNLEAMIIRDRNHPSIILWGVRINESSDHNTFYTKTNELARLLDPTRPTGGVRNFAKSEFLEDVYTYNDFIYDGTNKALAKKTSITKRRNPYLVSEFMGHTFPTKAYDNQSRRLEHALRHARIINESLSPRNKIAGAIAWCMADYNTHPEFGSGDLVCYHGVLDMFRMPKLASSFYASQQSIKPVLEISSTMDRGDYSAGLMEPIYVFTNADYIKLYRNIDLVDTFYPDKKRFPKLKHPPIVINDLLGNLLIQNEKLSKKDSKITKKIINEAKLRGANLRIITKLKAFALLRRNNLSYDEGTKLIYKYLDASTKATYRFEAYRGEEKTITKTYSPLKSSSLILELPSNIMKIDKTYDVMRIIVKKVNQEGLNLPYLNSSLSISVSGKAMLIGPNIISLINGEAAFYIKTGSEAGVATITVSEGKEEATEMVVVK